MKGHACSSSHVANPTPTIEASDAVDCGVPEPGVDVVDDGDAGNEVEDRPGELVDVWSEITEVLGTVFDSVDS